MAKVYYGRDYGEIKRLSNLLKADDVPHDMHFGKSGSGWQITFDWCTGDVICSWMSYHMLESYGFPWDDEDWGITRYSTAEEIAELIIKYYNGDKITQKDLRIGSILEDQNGERHTVIRFEGIFTVTTYGNGENWLVDSHLEHETLIKY